MQTQIAVLACLALAAACHSGQVPTRPPTPGADSLALERSSCFGFCPAYRLSLHSDGTVIFASRNPRDTARVESDAIRPDQVHWLVQEAERIGFFTLPSVIADDRALCPSLATDHPTATVTIFRADSASRVVDYHGCYAGTDLSVAPPVGQLRHFESQIDSVAKSERWTTPATHR